MYLLAFMHATVWMVNNRASEAAGWDRVGARCPPYFNYTVRLNRHVTFPNVWCRRARNHFRIQIKFSLNTITVVFSCKSNKLIYYSFVFNPAPSWKSFMLRMDQCCRVLWVHNDFANAVGSSSLNLLTKRGCTEHR